MDAERALELTRQHLPTAERITAIFEGTRSVAYEIDSQIIFKVAKAKAWGQALDTEACVLDHLQLSGWKYGPQLIARGNDPETGSYVCETRVPGISLHSRGRPWPTGSVNAVAAAVAQLHELPIHGALGAATVPVLDLEESWSDGIDFLLAHGYLTSGQADLLTRRFLEGRTGAPDQRPVLLHGDLWNDNCFIDDQTGNFTGLIDFGDASLGPAAWDLALITVPPPGWPEELLDAYVAVAGVGPAFRAEVELFRLVNAVSFLPRMIALARGDPWEKFVADIRRTLAFYLRDN